MDEGERDILKEYSSVFGDRLDLRGTKGREFKENSTLNVAYGANGKTLGNERDLIQNKARIRLQILLLHSTKTREKSCTFRAGIFI